MWLEASAWVGTVKRNNKKCTVKQWNSQYINTIQYTALILTLIKMEKYDQW